MGNLITEQLEVIYMNKVAPSQYPGLHRLMIAYLLQVIEIDIDGFTF